MTGRRPPVDPGERCHYCGAPATTQDHVVPLHLLRRGFHPATDVPWPTDLVNLVPACRPCNERKGGRRSDCGCDTCAAAWAALGELVPAVAALASVEADLRAGIT